MFGLKKIKRHSWLMVDGLAWVLRLTLRILIALWIGGFFWYVYSTPSIPSDTSKKTDAIIVLTGGHQRVKTGLSLLEKDFAPLLYVSGANPGTSTGQILAINNLPRDNYRHRVALGTKATTTYGNATETEEWVAKNQIHSIWLVTSHYHMKRSLLEFQRAMPDVQILPYAVQSDHKGKLWWWHPKTLGLLLSEYHKYILTLMRELGSAIDL